MKHINIAELLKDCPTGMELDCTTWDDVTLVHVDNEDIPFPITLCRKKDGSESYFVTTKYGQYYSDSKCVIFPKGKTTWEGFVPPVQFKEFNDGDIVATTDGLWIGITTGGTSGRLMSTYCVLKSSSKLETYLDSDRQWQFNRLATEEEKQKLFDSIKDNGYEWNAETKTLEKLIGPKFKIKKGKWYVCIKDLLDDYANKAFWKGDIYLSTQDGSLIPSNSNIPYKVEYCTDTYFRDWAIEDAKDGDILYIRAAFEWVCIYKENKDIKNIYKYAAINAPQDSTNIAVCDKISLLCKKDIIEIRPANEEEKQKLFRVIKDNGYKWNSNTKTLEKLVEPKFKVGDRIRHIVGREEFAIVVSVEELHYNLNSKVGTTSFSISLQREWELVPNKFDITTLIPFESRILVRAADNQFWRPAIWGVKQKDWDFYCVVGGEMWEQCIPYEGNEHLLGTIDDCDDYYKTW